MKDKFTLRSFQYSFGKDEQCLEAVKQLRFADEMECPKCKRVAKFYKVTDRTSYACNFCGHHIYPLAGTIFEKSTTPLSYWFFAMYLMTQTRAGTSAKQLERMLGVTYKTAWRMFKQIRMLMAQSPSLLDGVVEIDETFMGGKGKNKAYVPNFNEIPKEVVMGIVKRKGEAYFKHIPNTGKWTLLAQIKEHVDPTAHVMTDDYRGYIKLPELGYTHDTVNHSASQYVLGNIHNNTVEGFWSILKRGVYGVYRIVSKKYLQSYVDEYAYRYNHRADQNMFGDLLRQVAEVKMIKIV
ncbi:IS1595 family transposase [Candidatus Daviesbacteria bacterium]|nr:IS1595 family transposase [Candidatus Daviesbacteria bacterium]